MVKNGADLMSLINQMLRDLEQRELSTNGISPLRHQSVQITTAAPQPQSKYWLFTLVAILTAVVVWLYQQSTIAVPETLLPALPEQVVHSTKVFSTPDLQKPSVSAPRVTTNKTAPLPLAAVTRAVSEQGQYISRTEGQDIQKPPALARQTTTNKTVSKPAALKKATAHPPVTPKYSLRKKTKQQVLKITSRPKPEQLANNLYMQALKASSFVSAQTALEKALLLYPQHIDARLLLAKNHITQGWLRKSESLLDQGLQISPFELRLINARAQLYLQQKKAAAALTILQHIDTDNIDNETYLSLLAASYQQQQSFNKAVEIYHKLTLLNPDQAKFWLGLAIALEHLGKRQQALYAYHQAMGKNNLSDALVNYVNQRIQNP